MNGGFSAESEIRDQKQAEFCYNTPQFVKIVFMVVRVSHLTLPLVRPLLPKRCLELLSVMHRDTP